jgi:hypothetical protein
MPLPFFARMYAFDISFVKEFVFAGCGGLMYAGQQ